MSKRSDFTSFIRNITGATTDKSEKTFDIGILGQRELLEIFCFYKSYGNSDWFGCTGLNRVYYTYEYIYNYKKEDEVVYKFISESDLSWLTLSNKKTFL